MDKTDNKDYIVYKRTVPNGKVYIGMTKNSLEFRAGNNGYKYKNCKFFYSAIQKYGWRNIKSEILFDNLSFEEACEKEKEMIYFYKSNQREYGYNLTDGGQGCCGFVISQESRDKFSAMYSGEGNPFYGKKHTMETKNKISSANKGKYVGAKSARARSVYKIDLDTKEILEKYDCISDVPVGNAMRRHISDCCMGKRRSCNGFGWQYVDEPHEFKCNWSSLKPVVQLDKDTKILIKKFDNMREAVEETGTAQDSIKKVCDGNRKSAGGYSWMYLEDYERGVA